MDKTFLASNQRQLERLRQLAGAMTDEELVSPMPAGWTPASVLAHLAFWDRRALLLIDQWKQSGFRESSIDTDLINEVTRAFFISLPPREAVRLALENAEAIDQALAGLDDAFLEGMTAQGRAVQIDRGRHRAGHLDEIAQTLKSHHAK